MMIEFKEKMMTENVKSRQDREKEEMSKMKSQEELINIIAPNLFGTHSATITYNPNRG